MQSMAASWTLPSSSVRLSRGTRSTGHAPTGAGGPGSAASSASRCTSCGTSRCVRRAVRSLVNTTWPPSTRAHVALPVPVSWPASTQPVALRRADRTFQRQSCEPESSHTTRTTPSGSRATEGRRRWASESATTATGGAQVAPPSVEVLERRPMPTPLLSSTWESQAACSAPSSPNTRSTLRSARRSSPVAGSPSTLTAVDHSSAVADRCATRTSQSSGEVPSGCWSSGRGRAAREQRVRVEAAVVPRHRELPVRTDGDGRVQRRGKRADRVSASVPGLNGLSAVRFTGSASTPTSCAWTSNGPRSSSAQTTTGPRSVSAIAGCSERPVESVSSCSSSHVRPPSPLCRR
jgi:hypothetical protein